MKLWSKLPSLVRKQKLKADMAEEMWRHRRLLRSASGATSFFLCATRRICPMVLSSLVSPMRTVLLPVRGMKPTARFGPDSQDGAKPQDARSSADRRATGLPQANHAPATQGSSRANAPQRRLLEKHRRAFGAPMRSPVPHLGEPARL